MNSNNMLQLEGAVENIVYRNEQNGYTVLEIADGEDLITAVGIMPQASVGDTVNLTGFFITHKKQKLPSLTGLVVPSITKIFSCY